MKKNDYLINIIYVLLTLLLYLMNNKNWNVKIQLNSLFGYGLDYCCIKSFDRYN